MKKTIVVVDDEKDILNLIDKILSVRQYNILLARNGKELFEILEKTLPDLILLDVMMPGKDGYAVCAQLKSNPKTQGIPVIMITVLADPSHVEKGKNLGAIGYLTKPFEPKELEHEIRNVFKH